MRVRVLALTTVLAVVVNSAIAGQWDGTWKGTAGDWEVTLVVSGDKANLRMLCPKMGKQPYDESSTISVADGGALQGWYGGGALTRRRVIGGTLPKLAVSEVQANCVGGTATLTRQ